VARLHPHRSRLLLWGAVTALVLAPAAPAHAEPTLPEIDSQIDAAWRELEPLIEAHNRIRSELAANRDRSDELAEQIAPLEDAIAEAAADLEVIAARQYRRGGLSAFNSLVTSGSPTAFVEQLTLLDRVAHDQHRLIEAHRRARDAYERQRAEIGALIEEQRAQQADLAERRDEIERDLARLEGLRAQAEARTVASAPPVRASGNGLHIGDCPATTGSGPGAVAATFACGEIGKPYAWGTNGPGTYDCSGLTQRSWAAAGVSLTHFTGAQWHQGTPVNRADARPGDLVFFYSDLSHMGIYVGNGLMVHAPRSGDVVRMAWIEVMPVAGFRRPG
jgi:peptidoglycan DL-endopeptidase CwlO